MGEKKQKQKPKNTRLFNKTEAKAKKTKGFSIKLKQKQKKHNENKNQGILNESKHRERPGPLWLHGVQVVSWDRKFTKPNWARLDMTRLDKTF